MKKVIFVAALFVFAVAVSNAAWAIPAFSKKYETPCGTCHSSYPRLNDVGAKFQLNGFQLPDSEDGGDRAKFSPSENLFLDVGPANFPISAFAEGGVTLFQPKQGQEKQQNDKFLCCVNNNVLHADIGGSLAPNIGYYFSLPFNTNKDTDNKLDQGYVRFVNFFGPGYVSMDLGAMRVLDYDVIGQERDTLGSPIAIYGNPYYNYGKEIGMAVGHSDVGVRLYGRPLYKTFTYEGGMFTGAQLTKGGEDDSEKAYTLMGRMDVDRFAASLRYWGNRSGKIDISAINSGGTTYKFAADPTNSDETTQEFILGMRYRHPMVEVDLALDRTAFSLGGRTTTDTAGSTHTYSQGTINRTGASLGVLWLVNSWFETGLSYGYSTYDGYDIVLDGVSQSVSSKQVSMAQWKLNLKPAMNMNVGLEFQIDTSDSGARVRTDGTSFDAQNRALLTWNLAI